MAQASPKGLAILTTIIKLLIAALVLNACAQAGMAYFKLYQFQDAMHEVLLFAPNASDADVTARVMDLASTTACRWRPPRCRFEPSASSGRSPPGMRRTSPSCPASTRRPGRSSR